MDFELNADQEALVDAVADLCRGRFDIETVRGLAAVGGVDRSLWQELGAMGVFGLAVPESDGGVGLGWADTVLVLEVLGRHLVPGPLVATILAAHLLPSAVSGEAVVALVDRRDGSAMIEYGSVADHILILDDAGVSVVSAEDVTMTPAPVPLDPLTPVAQATALPAGEQVGDRSAAELIRIRGTILTAALQLGLAAGATDLAVSYAKDRHQFGKPIGQFQAVKHLCADMVAQVEFARASVYFAGVTLDDPQAGDPAEASSVAAIIAAEAADVCGKNCVQIHGGMGYTWEVDAHLYLKRSWVLDHAFGSVHDHAEALAARL